MRVFVLGNYINAHFLSVERLPLADESLAASRHFQEHGGKGLNLAVGLHRLGAKVDLLMAVGNDAAGVAVTHRLAEEGISTEWVLALGPHSGFGVGFIAPDGRNFLATHLGANALLTAEHVEQLSGVMVSADWVVAQFELPDPVIRCAFRQARQHDQYTYLNPSPWRPLDSQLLALTDLLIINSTEAALLFDQPALEAMTRSDWAAKLPAMARRLGWAGRFLVITLGETGCVALDETGQVVSEPAYRIRQMDATGAGDAFGCGLLWALMQGLPLAESLRMGNACGALVAAREGVLDSLPQPADITAFRALAVQD